MSEYLYQIPLLNDENQKKDFITQKIMPILTEQPKQIVKLTDFRKAAIYENMNTNQITTDDQKSFLINLCLSACSSLFLSWMINREEELLKKRIDTQLNEILSDQYTNENQQLIQKELLDWIGIIYGKSNILAKLISTPKMNKNGKTSAIHIYNLSLPWQMVAKKFMMHSFYQLSQGRFFCDIYAIIPLITSQFRDMITEICRTMVHMNIQLENYKPIADAILEELQKECMTDPVLMINSQIELQLTITQLDLIIIHSPPCIRRLIELIRNGTGINFDDALQLSLYMKSFLKKEDLITFWFQNDQRNRQYTSIDDFLTNAPDLIRHFEHHYSGKGNKGYSAMGCLTCQTRGYCYFTEQFSHLKTMFEAEYKTKETKESIANFLMLINKTIFNKRYMMACAQEFAFRHGFEIPSIYHPLQYWQMSYRSDVVKNAKPLIK